MIFFFGGDFDRSIAADLLGGRPHPPTPTHHRRHPPRAPSPDDPMALDQTVVQVKEKSVIG